MEEILRVLGPQLAIPAAMVGVGGWAITMLLGVIRTRSQSRVEFLNLWKGEKNMDDLELEVAIRHLTGSYLPAPLVRKLCSEPECAEALFGVSALFDLFKYDASTGRVSWAKPAYATWWGLCWREWAWLFSYFVTALFAFGCLALAFKFGPTRLVSWIWGFNALLFPFIAIGALARSEIVGSARTRARSWYDRLNAPAKNPRATRQQPRGRP
jgi:hypothetical protein